MSSELIKKISKDSVLVLILNAINYLSSFILAVLVARFLGIEAFGEYSLIFAFILILGIVSDFGLSTLLIRKLGENKQFASDLIKDFNLLKIIFSVIIIAFVFILSLLFFDKIFYPAFFAGLFMIIPRSLMSTYEASLRSFHNQKYPVLIRSINSFLQLAVSFVLLLKGFGLLNILLSLLTFDIAAMMMMMLANKKEMSEYISPENKSNRETVSLVKDLRSIISESSVFFINNFLMLSIKGMNVILLGYFSTTVSVGMYSAGARFANGIGLFSGALFNSFYPVISNIKNDPVLKTEVTKKFLLYSFLLGLLITVPVYFLSGELIKHTFEIPESVNVLKILSFTMIPVLIYTVTQSFLISVYNEIYLTRILILAWSMNILLSVILISLYDYTGCAVALTFTEIFLMITQLIKFKSDINKPELLMTNL